jgi:ubiquinone/menaquinone biosynthesis C-methylase UbiE
MDRKQHWDEVYSSKAADSVSWFQEYADRSLAIVRHLRPDLTSRIIDVGGGASTLVDGLLDAGYNDLSVLDLSGAALAVTRKRLGARAQGVNWIEADITCFEPPAQRFDLWHDRAVFHFLTTEDERASYKDILRHCLHRGSHVVIATFAEDGPERCSGLPVVRYSVEALRAELGPGFKLVGHEKELHRTPWGAVQSFLYAWFRVMR